MKSHHTPPLLRLIDLLALVAITAAFLLVILYAPVELTMGSVQMVFYFHVAASWTGMLGFLVATVAAIAYLKNSNLKWDIASLAGIEIGMVFIALGIVSGSIWARPVWNTWWTWDPRLTTTLIMELVYAAYLLLRSGLDEPRRRARLAAVYAIVGFASVPLTFISIRVFRTIHPVLVGSSDPSAGTFAMSARMQVAFFSSLAAFTTLFIALYWHRYRLGKAQNEVERKRLEFEAGGEA
jgi:heme exporter protein C